MAKTIVMTQQGKVLHKEDNVSSSSSSASPSRSPPNNRASHRLAVLEYWSDYKVFCKKMIPVIKTYGIEIKNILGKQKSAIKLSLD